MTQHTNDTESVYRFIQSNPRITRSEVYAALSINNVYRIISTLIDKEFLTMNSSGQLFTTNVPATFRKRNAKASTNITCTPAPSTVIANTNVVTADALKAQLDAIKSQLKAQREADRAVRKEAKAEQKKIKQTMQNQRLINSAQQHLTDIEEIQSTCMHVLKHYVDRDSFMVYLHIDNGYDKAKELREISSALLKIAELAELIGHIEDKIPDVWDHID